MTEPNLSAHDLASDILHGAEQIAAFIYGDRKKRRQVYHLVQAQSLPVFRLGATLCARRSTLLKWVETQEAASGAKTGAADP